MFWILLLLGIWLLLLVIANVYEFAAAGLRVLGDHGALPRKLAACVCMPAEL